METEYFKDERINASLLKQALISPLHALRCMQNVQSKPSDSMRLGTAVHAWYLERERFGNDYTLDVERYQRRTGEHNAGDIKTDEDGSPKLSLSCPDGVLTGEYAKRFQAMTDALAQSEKAQALLDGGRCEVELYTDLYKAKLDLITSDGWLVDLKTVGGGADEMPLRSESFAREFWRLGYDVQMWHYDLLAKANNIDAKGFIFLCVDAKIPAGVRSFVFERNSDWWEIGKDRWEKALKIIEKVKKDTDNNKKVLKYDETVYDLPVPFQAINEIAGLKNGKD